MPPRRSHKKSRSGCRRCKVRKIKCDEVHPRCGNCVKHGVPCDFENPEGATTPLTPAAPDSPVSAPTPLPSASGSYNAKMPLPRRSSPAASVALTPSGAPPLYRTVPSPTPSSATQPVGRLMELRLMHQYTSSTSATFALTAPVTEDIWRDKIPHIAFAGSSHLTDSMLAVAALHLRTITPNDKDLVRASHAYMASSLAEYSETLKKGINSANAEALFLTSTLIAFQSTATRIFNKDESAFAIAVPGEGQYRGAPHGYTPPLSWFHAFQGVKAITAASWPYLKNSGVVVPIIDSQPVLLLDFSTASEGFFGHLLEELDEELTEFSAASFGNDTPDGHDVPMIGGPNFPGTDVVTLTRHAYQHAVATLNWAHKTPVKRALAFPATVSKRFVELIEERRPRALAILACFFALLKTLDNVWWLQGMARREVLGVVSLFNSDFFGHDIERKWWPHLEWAVRVALYDDGQNSCFVPPEIWGTNWQVEETGKAPHTKFTNHIEMLSQMHAGGFQQPDDTERLPQSADPLEYELEHPPLD
ncbi:Sterol uptake control protein 2 [Pleurostoma richardsiae]|uniref:Sterol uptake control protein 2 n=1 Tax=Pleurostoma richardsiae TaxID=41990 RepID=A0AA38R2Z8_9PEZI|nr:Sterol uptake control protein 2 [Pleurostoma richardsiae]